MHQTALYATFAALGAIPLVASVGARMGDLHTAWWAQVLLEEPLENREPEFSRKFP